MSTYKEILCNASELLKAQEIEEADLDAWYLLEHVFGISRTDYLLRGDKDVDEAGYLHYLDLIGLRARHVPLQYITGVQEFMGLEYLVTPDVLIPRQDTEILVEEVLKLCDGKTVLDMCTGSGCIIISLSKLGMPRRTVGVDVSPKALEIAAKNAGMLGVDTEFIQSSLFDSVEDCFDIIVSNPPYIPTSVIDELMPEVKNHEPFIALDGDKDGLYFYRSITAQSKEHLSENGYLFYEIGYNQSEAVKEILINEGFADIIIKKDLSGNDRVVSARKS
jgi:release factor glutamine methyltransferase